MPPRSLSALATVTALVIANWPISFSPARPAPHPRDDHFTLSSDCGMCHLGAPGAEAMRDADGNDVSPYYLWQGTMMANAFRDPYFRAQLQKETEAVGPEVQELCLRCHTPMVHHEAVLAGEDPPRLAQAVELMEADDGVSCTVCHTIADEGLGTKGTWSGRPNFDGERAIFGPFADVVTRPMQNLVGYTPKQGEHIRKAALCATCHTLHTNHHGVEFPEQTPYLEWRNSDFSTEREGVEPGRGRTCQQCHMARLPKTRIARTPMGFDFRIPERAGYRAHAFVGGNAFVVDMLREHRADLYVEAEPEQLELIAAATRTQLAKRTAKLELSPLHFEDGELQFAIRVENLTGHKFPTAYPSRRAWLRVEVLVDGEVVFASGTVDADGRLVGVEDEQRIPHVTTIAKPSDVVVYELVAGDPDRQPTTYLTRMSSRLKDTRLLPKGWLPTGPHADETAPVGVGRDEDFVAGGDRVVVKVPLATRPADCKVRVALLYQTVPPVWVDALRDVEAEEAQRFVRYYDQATKKPELVDSATAEF